MATLKNTLIDDTGYLQLPSGTTAQRPVSPSAGYMRWNTTESYVEVYDGSGWKELGYFTPNIGTIDNPATNAAEILSVNPSAVDGDYYYKPTSYGGSPILCYTNFTNAPNGKGYVLVARGRESLDWWNSSGQNTTLLDEANLNVNSPISVAPNSFVDTLIGSNWNLMKMLTNRMNIGDSFTINGTSSSSFAWSLFNSVPASVNATITRYTNNWKGGTVSYTGTGTPYFTDTLTGGFTSNDCTRLFTWTWTGHLNGEGQFQGWSAGSGCTNGFQAGTETHAINLVNVYIEC